MIPKEVVQYLLEGAPWALTAVFCAIGYYFVIKNRNVQATDVADRAFDRMKQIECRLDVVNEKLRACEELGRGKDE